MGDMNCTIWGKRSIVSIYVFVGMKIDLPTMKIESPSMKIE
jgi:hypothetical protein